MDARYNELANAIQTYFDGLYHSDTKRLDQIFHKKAHYVCASETPMVHRLMDEYFAIVDKRPSPASRNERRTDQIVSMEFAGPKTAFARVNCSIGPNAYIDFLTFVLVDDRWQIISKVFHTAPHEP